MLRLPPGEAAKRHADRNRLKNEYRKANKIKTIIVLTEKRKAEMREYARQLRANRKVESDFKPKGDPARLKQMKEYAKIARALAKSNTAEERLRNQKVKQERIERMKMERAEAKLAKKQFTRDKANEQKRTKYSLSKPDNWVDGRTLKKQPKPKAPRKPQTAKVKKMGKVVKEAKPLKIINSSLDGKIPLVISPKLTVYIRPDQNPDLVRAKYLNR